MFTIKNSSLLATLAIVLVAFGGCAQGPSAKKVDSFGEKRAAPEESASADDGLKLLNVHRQEFSSDYKSEYSNEPSN